MGNYLNHASNRDTLKYSEGGISGKISIKIFCVRIGSGHENLVITNNSKPNTDEILNLKEN